MRFPTCLILSESERLCRRVVGEREIASLDVAEFRVGDDDAVEQSARFHLVGRALIFLRERILALVDVEVHLSGQCFARVVPDEVHAVGDVETLRRLRVNRAAVRYEDIALEDYAQVLLLTRDYKRAALAEREDVAPTRLFAP